MPQTPSPATVFVCIGALFATSAWVIFQGVDGIRAGEIRVPGKGESRFVKESQDTHAYWTAVYSHFGVALLVSGVASWWGIKALREHKRSKA